MDKMKYKYMFRGLIRIRHGIDVDFEAIEKKLIHLRYGDALTYSDLISIADDSCWPFSKYWIWPHKEQIKDKLDATKNYFVNLPNSEEKIIGQLLDIFKNISLVSIILRFVRPRYYAIYSRPPLYILRVERGMNDIKEYLNYIYELRTLRDSFKEFRTAEVDMIVWAIAELSNKNYKSKDDKNTLIKFKKLLADKLPENLSPEEIIQYLINDPLKIAEIYLRKNDYKTAGMWAGRAFEKYINKIRKQSSNLSPGWEHDDLIDKIKCVCKSEKFEKNKLVYDKLRKLRNHAMHEGKHYSEDDANFAIYKLKKLICNL
jgi:hypothetical protein